MTGRTCQQPKVRENLVYHLNYHIENIRDAVRTRFLEYFLDKFSSPEKLDATRRDHGKPIEALESSEYGPKRKSNDRKKKISNIPPC